MILSKMKNILITSSLLATLIGCSAAVDDELQKDTFEESISEIESQEAKNSSNETMSSNPLRYTSFKLLNKDNIFQKNDSIDPVGRNYTLEMCMDLSVDRSLDGVMFIVTNSSGKRDVKRSNSKGCIRWQENIELNYKAKRQKEQFSIEIESKFNENNPLTIKYTIEPFAKDNFVDRTGLGFIRDQKSGEAEFAASEGLIEMNKIKATPKNYGNIDPRNDNLIIDKVVDFNTCLINKQNEQKLRNESVDVELSRIYTEDEEAELKKLGKKKYKRVAKNIKLIGSCLSISFIIDYARYRNTRRIPYTFTVKTKSKKLEGASRTRKLCLYPWTNSGWSFVHDTISGPCPTDQVDERARIFVQEADFEFHGHEQYYVNKNLDLTIKKRYFISMQPKIDYGNFIHVIKKTEPIYEGNFRLKVLLLAPKKGQIKLDHKGLINGDYQIVSSTSKEVFIEDEKLREDLDFDIKFNDLPFIHTRMFAVIRLEHLDNDSPNAPLPSTTVGMFHASNKSFRSYVKEQISVDEHTHKRKSLEARSFEDTLNSMFAYAETRNNKYATSPMIKEWINKDTINPEKKFTEKAKKNFGKNYKEISLEDFTKITKQKVSKNKLKELMEDKYSLETMKSLCNLLISEENQYNFNKCQESPEIFMNISSFDHIAEIKSKPSLLSSKSVRLYTSAGRDNFHGESNRISTSRRTSVGGKVGMKIDLPLIFSAGADYGFDISKMYGRDTQTGKSNRASSGTNNDIQFDSLTLKFKALSRRCFVVDGTIKFKRTFKFENTDKSSFSTLRGPSVVYEPYASPKRIRVCEDKPTVREVSESWFFIGEGHQFYSVLRDPQSLAENPYTLLIRGDKNMTNFVRFLQENGEKVMIKDIKKSVVASEYLTRSYKEFQEKFNHNVYKVFDAGLPGTIIKFAPLASSADKYYGELPGETEFKLFASPWKDRYEEDLKSAGK